MEYLKFKLPNVTIIEGGASGADACGKRFAQEYGLELIEIPANWNEYGRAAGPIRNLEMAKIADALIAFWDGSSHGTGDMIKKAKENNLQVRIVNFK